MPDFPSIDGGHRLPETTRVARVLDIIWRISARPRYWTRARLAEQFEVSQRTIQADLDIVRNRLMFGLKTERGKGYYFESLPQLPAVNYSVPEAMALILAAEAGRHLDGISEQDLASAIARLESVFPGELGRMVRKRAERESATELTHRQRMVQTCMSASISRQRLHIEYTTASRGGVETRRDVDPYAVIPYQRAWHMVGYCHTRHEPRVFKIDRIQSAAPTGASFTTPRDFDITAFLSEGWGLIRGLDGPVERVELRFSPTAARWIVDEQWHPAQQLRPEANGELTFVIEVQITPELQRWVFGFGREVNVVAPHSLNEWVKEEARAIIQRVA
jgi:predicted DNA-binding transcriptional regulator YafY